LNTTTKEIYEKFNFTKLELEKVCIFLVFKNISFKLQGKKVKIVHVIFSYAPSKSSIVNHQLPASSFRWK